MVGSEAGYAAVWGPSKEGRDIEDLTAGRRQWIELLGLLQETLGLLAITGVQGLSGYFDAFLRLIPVPLHGLHLPFPPGAQLRGAEAAAEEARPARAGACGGERGGAQGPRRRRRRRPRRTGGLAAPPPRSGLPAPRGRLRREPYLPTPGWSSGARGPGPGCRSRLRSPCAARGGSGPYNPRGGQATPARRPTGAFRRGGALPPYQRARP